MISSSRKSGILLSARGRRTQFWSTNRIQITERSQVCQLGSQKARELTKPFQVNNHHRRKERKKKNNNNQLSFYLCIMEYIIRNLRDKITINLELNLENSDAKLKSVYLKRAWVFFFLALGGQKWNKSFWKKEAKAFVNSRVMQRKYI